MAKKQQILQSVPLVAIDLGSQAVRAMAAEGNPASVSDAGVGALAARSAVLGAQLNVRINAAGLNDREAAERLCAEAAEIAAKAIAEETEVLEIVNSKI
jgi:glutamate formiminotransferase/formiminotetrahydrofolate cyclodeaminase